MKHNRMMPAETMSKEETVEKLQAPPQSDVPVLRTDCPVGGIYRRFHRLLAVLAPQWLSKLTDEIMDHAATQSIDLKRIMNIAIVLIVFYASNAILNYLSNFIMTTITQKYTKKVRGQISRKINRIPLKYYDSHQYGDTLSVITNDVDTVGSSIQQAASMFISSICLLTGVLIAMFVTCWQMALTTLLIVPLMMIMLVILTKFAMAAVQKASAVSRRAGGQGGGELYGADGD